MQLELTGQAEGEDSAAGVATLHRTVEAGAGRVASQAGRANPVPRGETREFFQLVRQRCRRSGSSLQRTSRGRFVANSGLRRNRRADQAPAGPAPIAPLVSARPVPGRVATGKRREASETLERRAFGLLLGGSPEAVIDTTQQLAGVAQR